MKLLGLRWRWVCLSGITCCLAVLLSASWLAAPSSAKTASQIDAYVHSVEAYRVEPDSVESDSVDVEPGSIDLDSTGLADSSAAPVAVSMTTLLNQGKQHYDAGQFSLAVALWQQAVDQENVDQENVDQENVDQENARAESNRQTAIAYHYLAIGQQALGQWSAAIAAIDQAKARISEDSEPFVYAQVLNTEGNLRLEMGQTESALTIWRQAEALYRSQSDAFALVHNQLNQIHALRVLGHYRQARQSLEALTQDLSAEPDSWTKARALESLGITLRAIGDLNRSQLTLAEALAIAEALPLEALPDADTLESLRLSLAKTLAAANDLEQAILLASQVRNQSDRIETQIEAALLQLSCWQKQNESLKAEDQAEDQNDPSNWDALRSTLQTQLKALPASRWGVYAEVNLAAIASKSAVQINSWNPDLTSVATLLADAVQKARSLSDQRAQSYALGELGKVYEQAGQWADALQITQQALELAEQIRSVDVAAKWQWQKGRILSQANNPAQDLDQAVVAYTRAVDGLESIQQDLVAMNPEVQFSFREQVEPVYRQLVGLLLKDIDTRALDDKQQRLEQSQQVIESLQLAELQNYFREACLTYEA
ncbi:MAG: hypothetical protein WA901_05195, partial [Phormidesmis sp.]